MTVTQEANRTPGRRKIKKKKGKKTVRSARRLDRANRRVAQVKVINHFPASPLSPGPCPRVITDLDESVAEHSIAGEKILIMEKIG